MRDWKAAFVIPPARFEAAVERALREKEKNRMIRGKRKWTILLVAALTVALLAGMAYAAVESGLIGKLKRYGIEPAEGAEDVIARDLGSATAGNVTMTVTEAAYAGKTLDLMIEFIGGSLQHASNGNLKVAAQEMEFDNISVGSWNDGDVRMAWVTITFDRQAPDRLSLTVTALNGLEVSFAIDKTEAEAVTPITEKTVSDDGTLTVYSFELYRSPLSQVAFVNYDYDLPEPRMGYTIEFLDADGNVLDYGMGGSVGLGILEDGTEVFRQETILGLDAEVAALRIVKNSEEKTFGTVPVPQY